MCVLGGEGVGVGGSGGAGIAHAWRQSTSSSIQDGICAVGKAHTRSTQSLRSVPNVAFETVPVFV